MVKCAFIFVLKALFNREHSRPVNQKSLHTGGVEMAARIGFQEADGLLHGPGFFVRSFGGQGIKHIGHRHNSAKDGNSLTH